MEKILQTILEEVQSTKTELHEQMQNMKQEICKEMDRKLEETKTELRQEMNNKIDQQSKEIAQELNQITILQERKDNRLEAKIDKALGIQTQMLQDIKEIKIDLKEHEYRISKLEYEYEKVS